MINSLLARDQLIEVPIEKVDLVVLAAFGFVLLLAALFLLTTGLALSFVGGLLLLPLSHDFLLLVLLLHDLDDFLGALGYQVVAISVDKSARVVYHTFKQMEEDQEILVVIFVWLLAQLYIVLHLKKLCPYVFEGLYIGMYSSDGLIHLNNLFKDEFFLSLLHQGHYFSAIYDKVLLLLHLKVLHLFEVINLHLN